MAMRTLESIADAVVDSLAPSKRRALSEAQLNDAFDALRRDARERRRAYRMLVGSRRQWPLLTEEELRAIIRRTERHHSQREQMVEAGERIGPARR